MDGEIAAGEQQSWTFQAASGEALSFSVKATSGNLDPAFTISNSAGMVLIGNDDTNYPDEQDALLEAITIPRTGTYTVTVSGVGQTAGSYSLTMLPGFSQVEQNENFNGDFNWTVVGDVGQLENIEGKLSMAVEGRLLADVAVPPNNTLPETYYAQVDMNVSSGNGWITGLSVRQDGENYYLLAINSNGQWRFSLHQADGEHIIHEWTPHPAIIAGQATFTLGILVNGSGFDFFYDGQGFGHLTDSTLPESGGLGLWVGTPDSLSAHANGAFDNLIVTIPSEINNQRMIPQQLIVSTPADMVQELQRRGLIPAAGEMALTVNESFVESRRPGVEQFLLGRGVTFQNFAMGATVTWQAQSTGVTGCGFVVRAIDDGNYTVAYIDQSGGYGVSRREGDSFQPGIFGEKAQLTSDTHHLLVIAVGDRLYYYIDGQYSGMVDNPAQDGAVGDAVVNFEPISTSCTYSGTWLWRWEGN